MCSFSGYCCQTLNFFAQMLILVKVIRLEYQVGMVCRMIWLVLCLQFVSSSFNVAGVSSSIPQSCADPGCVQSISGNNFAPPAMLLFAKTRKLSVERSDPRKYVYLSLSPIFMKKAK